VFFGKLLPSEGNFFELFNQIDREQIHGLINAADDILDLLQDATETMSLCDVCEMNEDILRLGDLSAKCSERVRHALALLPRISRSRAPKQRSRPAAKRSTRSSLIPTG
jgi:uncharacterized protein Yka (UPF0111/DUF47 family)